MLEASTIATVEAQIDKIEADTGAEIVVFTQLVDGGVDYVQAEQHAIALMDQWGVGRAGVNDGLVILFDLYQDDPCHGQVQMYAGSGYRDAWLSNDDRQRIFENDMLPQPADGATSTARCSRRWTRSARSPAPGSSTRCWGWSWRPPSWS